MGNSHLHIDYRTMSSDEREVGQMRSAGRMISGSPGMEANSANSVGDDA